MEILAKYRIEVNQDACRTIPSRKIQKRSFSSLEPRARILFKVEFNQIRSNSIRVA